MRSSGSGTVAAFSDSALVRLAEPAALGERRGEHPLQLRRGAGDDRLRLGEALGVGQPLDRGLEPLVVSAMPSLAPELRLFRMAQGRAASPARPPTTPPTRPAKTSAVDSKIGRASSTAAATATPIRS